MKNKTITEFGSRIIWRMMEIEEGGIRIGLIGSSSIFIIDLFGLLNVVPNSNIPGLRLAKFILETSYPSRRIICPTDNSSKYKSEDEFWRIICLDILRGRQETLRKYRNQSLSCGTSSKKPFTFRLDINLARLQDVLTDESAGELSVWWIIRLDG